jgi:mannose-6-phosphate isomerase-like protein (cupin superfamily)
MSQATPINLAQALARVRPLRGRTPQTTAQQAEGSFATLCEYRDGAVFVSSFDGMSEWERHVADEVVHVLDGETVIVLWLDSQEVRHSLKAGELVVVPERTWHRFETAGVTLLTVSPQPTDHSAEHPSSRSTA